MQLVDEHRAAAAAREEMRRARARKREDAKIYEGAIEKSQRASEMK